MNEDKSASSQLDRVETLEEKADGLPGLSWAISYTGGRTKQQVRDALHDIGLHDIVLAADVADNHFAYEARSSSNNVLITIAVTRNNKTHYMASYNSGSGGEARSIRETAMDNLGH